MDCCSGMHGPGTAGLDLWLLLGTGLTISLGHCLGMCGPLVTTFSLSQRSDGTSGWRLWPRLLLYHTGRLSGYALLGALFGAVGATAGLVGDGRHFQGGFSLVVGGVMLLLGAGLLGLLPTQRWLSGGRYQAEVAGRLRAWLQATTWRRRWLFGLGNGLLPCGPVYAVALSAAAAAKPAAGAVAMLAFGLGTVPVLLLLGLGAARLTVRWRLFFSRFGALMVVLLAVQMLLRGAAALGWIAHLRLGEVVVW